MLNRLSNSAPFACLVEVLLGKNLKDNFCLPRILYFSSGLLLLPGNSCCTLRIKSLFPQKLETLGFFNGIIFKVKTFWQKAQKQLKRKQLLLTDS